MNAALFRKSWYDNRWAMLIAVLATTLFPILVIQAFASFPWELATQWLQVPWISGLIRALTGAEFSNELSVTTVGSFVFVHPVTLAITWGYIIMAGTRAVCGEIDRGTAEVAFTFPASRIGSYVSVSLPVFLACPILVLSLWNGAWLGNLLADLPDHMQVAQLRHVAANACVMLWAVTGMTFLFSAAGSRRGKVVGLIVALLIASFVINSLAALWKPAESLAFLGLLHYFRPFVVVIEGGYPWGDIVALLALAAATWVAGAVIFHRRDIHAA
jgi:ABC-type transport system involved in multi-copper enzyme maturation permease subunit